MNYFRYIYQTLFVVLLVLFVIDKISFLSLSFFWDETWVYGNEASSLDMVFTFVKVYNPFADNDYALAKLNKYRFIWGQAIDGWRHGTAYGLKEIIREQDERDQQVRMANQPYSWN